MRHIYKTLFLNLSAIGFGYIQALWASPEGPSSVDMSNSPFFYLHWYVIFTLIVLNILLLILKKRHSSAKITAMISTLGLIMSWLLINYMEFNDRIAAWSTFSELELWYYVLYASALTTGICGFAFFCIAYYLCKKPDQDTIIG